LDTTSRHKPTQVLHHIQIADCLACSNLLGLTSAVLLVTAVVALALNLGETVVGVSSLNQSAKVITHNHDYYTYLVAIVEVDTHKLTTIDSSSSLHMHGASAVATAVTTRPVHLTVVIGIEVDNVYVTTSVVLNNLISGLVSTATDDIGCTAALDGDGILADILKPHEFKSARSLAVDAFYLVGTNDDVAQLRAVFKDENSVLFT
jgi:hypothetical protein